MIRSTLTIQKTAFIQIARHPVFYLVLAFAAFLVFISQKLVLFSFHTELNMIRELGLSTLVLWGVFTCILFTHQSVFAEFENRSAMTLLSKPVFRSSYVVGKYLGLFRALFLGAFLLTLTLILTLWIHEGLPKLELSLIKSSSASLHVHMDSPPHDMMSGPVFSLGGSSLGAPLRHATTPGEDVWAYVTGQFVPINVFPMLLGGLLAFAQIAVIASFSLCLATFFPTVVVAVGTLSFYLVGHLTDYLVGLLHSDVTISVIVRLLIRCVLPNLEQFNPVDHLSRGDALPTIYVALALAYGTLYVLVVLGTTSFAFSRRELP